MLCVEPYNAIAATAAVAHKADYNSLTDSHISLPNGLTYPKNILRKHDKEKYAATGGWFGWLLCPALQCSRGRSIMEQRSLSQAPSRRSCVWSRMPSTSCSLLQLTRLLTPFLLNNCSSWGNKPQDGLRCLSLFTRFSWQLECLRMKPGNKCSFSPRLFLMTFVWWGHWLLTRRIPVACSGEVFKLQSYSRNTSNWSSTSTLMCLICLHSHLYSMKGRRLRRLSPPLEHWSSW